MRVLIVEDDPKILGILQEGLEQEGYSVDKAEDGKEGYYLATTNSYDVMLFDVMIPFMDGMELCQEIRKQDITTPVLFLTAKDDTPSLIKALDIGGDDYITKPFKLDELFARIRVALRKQQKISKLQHLDIEYDPTTKQVSKAGEVLQLTQKEIAILELFLRNIGTVLSESTILEHLWDMESSTQSNIVNVYIYRLRKKIDTDANNRLIHTVKNVGYVMR